MVTAKRMAIATITGIRTRMAEFIKTDCWGVIPASEPGSTRMPACRSSRDSKPDSLQVIGSPLKAGMTGEVGGYQ